MIRGVAETGGVEPRVPAAAATPKAPTGGGFAAELDREAKKDTKKSPAAKPAQQVPERTAPVAGHLYAEVTAGPRNGMFINTSGNERHGQAFLVVERAGRTFHVYGTGDSRAVFEVKPEPAPKAPATTPAATTPPATTPGTTIPAATAPATPPLATIPGVTTPAIPSALPSIR